jgi:hypothetical protein
MAVEATAGNEATTTLSGKRHTDATMASCEARKRDRDSAEKGANRGDDATDHNERQNAKRARAPSDETTESMADGVTAQNMHTEAPTDATVDVAAARDGEHEVVSQGASPPQHADASPHAHAGDPNVVVCDCGCVHLDVGDDDDNDDDEVGVKADSESDGSDDVSDGLGRGNDHDDDDDDPTPRLDHGWGR